MQSGTMAATLPFSRSYAHPAPLDSTFNGDFATQQADPYEQWGPNSLPPSSGSNIPWDEQVVPALRKKLEQESTKLGRRISAIEASDGGWTASAIRSRESIERRDSRPPPHVRPTMLAEEEREAGDALGGTRNAYAAGQYPSGSRHQTAAAGDDNGNGLSRNASAASRVRARVQSSAVSMQPTNGRGSGGNGVANGSIGRTPSQLRNGPGPVRDDATARVVERARKLARERAESIRAGGSSTDSPSSRSGHGGSTQRPQQQQTGGEGKTNGDRQRSFASEQQQTAFPSEDGHQPHHQATPPEQRRGQTSFEQHRLRTHSTPMKYAGPSSGCRPSGNNGCVAGAGVSEAEYLTTPQAPAHTQAEPGGGQERTSFNSGRRRESTSSNVGRSTPRTNGRQPLSRVNRNALPADDALSEFGPLGGVAKRDSAKSTPTRTATKRSNPTIQPDAFRSLSPHRYVAGPADTTLSGGSHLLSATSEFGSIGPPPVVSVSKLSSAYAWDDEIIPTVARRLQQEMLMAGDPRLSHVDGLIDTWDRNGLPLSKSEVARRIKQVQEESAAGRRSYGGAGNDDDTPSGEHDASQRDGQGKSEAAIRAAQEALEGQMVAEQQQQQQHFDDTTMQRDREGDRRDSQHQESYEMQSLQRPTQDDRHSRTSRGRRSHAEEEEGGEEHRQGQQQLQQHYQQQQQQQQQQLFQPAPVHAMAASGSPQRQAQQQTQQEAEDEAVCCKCTVM